MDRFFQRCQEWMVLRHHPHNSALLGKRGFLQFGLICKAIPVADAKGADSISHLSS